jgi:hypothetical protein
MANYICSKCGSKVCKKLCEDCPGAHSYIWACEGCHEEYGDEWIEYHHPNPQRVSEQSSVLNLVKQL